MIVKQILGRGKPEDFTADAVMQVLKEKEKNPRRKEKQRSMPTSTSGKAERKTSRTSSTARSLRS